MGYTRGLEEVHPAASNHVAAEVLTQQFQHLVLVHGDWIREVDDDAADLTLDTLRTLPPSSRRFIFRLYFIQRGGTGGIRAGFGDGCSDPARLCSHPDGCAADHPRQPTHGVLPGAHQLRRHSLQRRERYAVEGTLDVRGDDVRGTRHRLRTGDGPIITVHIIVPISVLLSLLGDFRRLLRRAPPSDERSQPAVHVPVVTHVRAHHTRPSASLVPQHVEHAL